MTRLVEYAPEHAAVVVGWLNGDAELRTAVGSEGVTFSVEEELALQQELVSQGANATRWRRIVVVCDEVVGDVDFFLRPGDGRRSVVAEVNIMVPHARGRGIGREAFERAKEMLIDDLRAERIAAPLMPAETIVFEAVVLSDNTAGNAFFRAVGMHDVRSNPAFNERVYASDPIPL